ncbi:MAG TPA: hypothetical protein VMZ53_17430 [Kofleriaceae bacterium]|nr:hypothetical protein [Kofleriaceae bacterium]
MSTIDDEVRDALKELVEEIGATSARIVDEDSDPRVGVPARTLALGGGEYLRVELPTRVERETGNEHDIESAFERITRTLRGIRRRYEVARLPEVSFAPGTLPPGGKVLERIESYMQALAQIDQASNAFVTRGTRLIASAKPPDEMEGSRWPFLARRALSTHAPGSSHGEVVDPDAFAMSFWYDAALVVLMNGPYGVDFVRHRCKQVARELCNLIPMLDPDPEAPAAIGPRPRRPTQP